MQWQCGILSFNPIELDDIRLNGVVLHAVKLKSNAIVMGFLTVKFWVPQTYSGHHNDKRRHKHHSFRQMYESVTQTING